MTSAYRPYIECPPSSGDTTRYSPLYFFAHYFRVFLIIVMLLIISSLAAERHVIRFEHPSNVLLAMLVSEGIDIASFRPGEYVDVVVSDNDLAFMQSYGKFKIVMSESDQLAGMTADRDITGYRSYSQMVTELMQLQAQYPNLVQVSSLGSSWGSIYSGMGYPAYSAYDHQIWAVKISNNVQLTEDEPAFYFVGEHHAREPISMEMCMQVINHLADNYGLDTQVTNILDNAEIWVVPLLNPDGHKIVIDQNDIWWRKNLRDNNNNLFPNYGNYGVDGVDLNRNYSYHWGYMSATDDLTSATYHGPNPGSEPEVLALTQLLQTRRFLAGISYHTYGEMVLYPFGYTYNAISPDRDELQALAVQMASAIPSQTPQVYYSPLPSWSLYPVSGSSDDWIYSQTGAFAYTIEMAQSFIPPVSQISQIIQGNMGAAMLLLNRMNTKILKGHVYDSESGLPLSAEIFVHEIDNSPIYRTPITSDSIFGAYYRLLPEGTFRVSYFVPGYRTEERMITINGSGATIEDIYMEPIDNLDLQISIIGDFAQPIPDATLILNDDIAAVYQSDDSGSIHIQNFTPGNYRIQVTSAGFGTLNFRRDIYSPNISLRMTSGAAINEDFEQSLSAWQTTGNWNRTNVQSYGGSYSMTDSPGQNYQNNSNAIAKLIEPLRLYDVEFATLEFWIKHTFAPDGDNCALEYSLDEQNWYVLDYFTGISDWQKRSINLNGFTGNDVYLRFRLVSNGYIAADGIYIDDFRLYLSNNVSSIDDNLSQPIQRIFSVYPNPFLGDVKLYYSTTSGNDILTLHVYNIRGQLLRQIPNIHLTGKAVSIDWDGNDANGNVAANGLYIFKLTSGTRTMATSKAVKLK